VGGCASVVECSGPLPSAAHGTGYFWPLSETPPFVDLKALVYDHFGHFAPADIAVILFGMFVAAFLGWLAGLIGKSSEGDRRHGAFMAAAISLAVAVVRASLPLSVALVAVALLLRFPERENNAGSMGMRVVVVAIGIGCGASAAMITILPALLLALLLRWANARN